jgi:eukaryotic-like serine/threonine-protein kinase
MAPDDDKTQAMTVLSKGTLIGHYRIVEKIGSGGMGEVYLAEDTELNRNVALKFLPSHFLSDPDCIARFKREAQAAAQLNHPNIVTIHEVSEHNGRPYIVMEYLGGQSLRDIVDHEQLPFKQVVDIAIQLGEGLQAAHSAGIVHRDIKPGNVLRDYTGRYKLVDFGLAAMSGGEKLTQAGSILGTIGYMSPEQVHGEGGDASSDIFSFGVVLYEMITGKHPFRGDNQAATIHAILYDQPNPVTDVRPDTPQELVEVIGKAMAKDRSNRYEQTSQLLTDLRKIKGKLERDNFNSATAGRNQPSVAVLPFTNLSADREQEYFCDGMAEEIISALTYVENLRVVARTSSFSFKGKDFDIREIGRRLNVETLLEGSVRRSGQHLRIIAQLVNVADGYHLWSERFDRQMDDVFAIQDEIALAIVDRLKVKLLKDEKALLTRRYTDNQEAYHLYLKGRFFWNRRYEGGLQKGIEFFEQAVKKDAMYAPAYVGIADCYNQLAHWGYQAAKEAYPIAKSATEKALSIDGSLAEAHASLGWITLWHDWNWSVAEKEFRCALELNPNYAMAYEWYALYLAVMERIDEAIGEVKKAVELDPLSLVANSVLGLGYYWGRRYDEAVQQLNRTLELDADFPLAHLYLGWTYAGKRLWQEAIHACEQFAALSHGSALSLGYLGAVYGLAGNSARALEVLAQIEELSKNRYVSPLYRATVYIGIGDLDQVILHLEQARLDRESFLPVINTFPLFDPLRSDERFSNLLRQIGL